MENASDLSRIHWLCNYDDDDATMTPQVLGDAVSLAYRLGASLALEHQANSSKIEAINAHMGKAGEWNILLLISDDMFCCRKNWDDIIHSKMTELYPETDGALWFHDGSKQRVISTLSCMGRRFYERFGYIYHPSYKSFWSDNEYTDVARALGKITFIEHGVATHEHPAWNGGMKTDATYMRNNKFWRQDEANYHRRKALGFPL